MKNFKAPLTKTEENPNEMYLRWYLEELKQFGYIKRIDRESETFLVSPNIPYQREVHYKSKPNKLETFNLFSETTYTYDFRVIWTEKALNLFTEVLELGGYFVFGKPVFVSNKIEVDGVVEIVSYIDAKPHHKAVSFGGGKMASYYTFPFVQKTLYQMTGIYINKIVPVHSGKHGRSTCLFATTFVPQRYKRTDKSMTKRNIPYSTRPLSSYVTQKQKIVDEMLRVKNSKNSQQTLL